MAPAKAAAPRAEDEEVPIPGSFALRSASAPELWSSPDGGLAELQATNEVVGNDSTLMAATQSTQCSGSNNRSLKRGESTFSGDELTKLIRQQVRGIVIDRTGPSFEERLAAASASYRRKTAAVEKLQKEIIANALERARQRPSESQVRPRHLWPESIETRAERGLKVVMSNTSEHWKHVETLKEKMATREPLFRVSAVQAAVRELEERKAARKRELSEEEARRWEMISGLKAKVLERPLAMESFEKAPIKPIDLKRMASTDPGPLGVDKKIHDAISSKSFQDSGWAAQVREIRERADNRQKLHEISYPRYEPPPPKPYTKEVVGLDKLIQATVNQSWFKNCDWMRQVGDIKERQNNRPKLHEISYPKRVPEAEKEVKTNAFLEKIARDNEVKAEARRQQMVAEERKQRQLIKDATKEALLRRDRSAVGLPNH